MFPGNRGWSSNAKTAHIKKGAIQNSNGESVETFMQLMSMDKCGCFYVDCCPCPHFKLESINGDGIDFHWNDSGTITSGTYEEFEAACDAAKEALEGGEGK